MPPDKSLEIRNSASAFALYEVLIGVAIFALGVLALGRAVENCLNASTLNAEEERVRQILSNRMAEVQTAPGLPDATKEFNREIDSEDCAGCFNRARQRSAKRDQSCDFNRTVDAEWNYAVKTDSLLCLSAALIRARY